MANTTKLVVAAFYFLQNELKYPLDSIAVGQWADDHMQPSVTIVDTSSSRTLGYIEFIEDATPSSLETKAAAFHQLLLRLNQDVPVYFFCPSERDTHSVQIFQLTGNSHYKEINRDMFPSIDTLIALHKSKVESALRAQTKEVVNSFNFAAYALGIFLLILFGISILGLEFSNHQLMLLATACFIILLPHYPNIRIVLKDLELELRHTEPADRTRATVE